MERPNAISHPPVPRTDLVAAVAGGPATAPALLLSGLGDLGGPGDHGPGQSHRRPGQVLRRGDRQTMAAGLRAEHGR